MISRTYIFDKMKSIVAAIILFGLALSSAKPNKLHLRNAFKHNQQNQPSPRIYGGTLAAPHSIPFQAFLEFFSQHSIQYCGGSLISQNYVLTSAWCVASSIEVQVTLGAHFIFQDEDTQINVYSTNVFKNQTNHMGLVKLPNPVTFTDAIQPATLPRRADVGTNFDGVVGRMSGWGTEDYVILRPSEVLKYADVELANDCGYPDVICTNGYDDDDDVARGPCQFDDGGPLVVDGVLVAIVRIEYFLCGPGLETNNARIDSSLDWIEENSDVVIE